MTGPGLTVIVDGANVVGSRPDGWWRDRPAAARRLRAELDRLPGRAVTAPDGRSVMIARVVLVVEGQAAVIAAERGIEPGAEVVAARGHGDDEVVRQARAAAATAIVVTADRALRARVEALGASTAGPRWYERRILQALTQAPARRDS